MAALSLNFCFFCIHITMLCLQQVFSYFGHLVQYNFDCDLYFAIMYFAIVLPLQ